MYDFRVTQLNISYAQDVTSSRCYANQTFEASQPKHQDRAETQNRSVIWEAVQSAWPLLSQRKQLHPLKSATVVMHILKVLFPARLRMAFGGFVGNENDSWCHDVSSCCTSICWFNFLLMINIRILLSLCALSLQTMDKSACFILLYTKDSVSTIWFTELWYISDTTKVEIHRKKSSVCLMC